MLGDVISREPVHQLGILFRETFLENQFSTIFPQMLVWSSLLYGTTDGILLGAVFSPRHSINSAIAGPQFLVDNRPAPDVSIIPAVVVYVDNGVHAGQSRERVQADKEKSSRISTKYG